MNHQYINLQLLTALLCFSVHAKADLSGVLQHQQKVTLVDKNGTRRTVEKPFFDVDSRGSISVESMKGTEYYAHAQACDAKCRNGWLQCEEIRPFLKLFRNGDISTGSNDLVYYRERNEQGVVVKICTIVTNREVKNFGEGQMVLLYDNEGELMTQLMYQRPGQEYQGTYIYDLKSGMFTKVNEQGDTLIHRPLNAKNYRLARRSSNRVKHQQDQSLWVILKYLSLGGLCFLSFLTSIYDPDFKQIRKDKKPIKPKKPQKPERIPRAKRQKRMK